MPPVSHQQTFRKKPYSHIERDKRRSEAFAKRKQQPVQNENVIVSSPLLFQSTPCKQSSDQQSDEENEHLCSISDGSMTPDQNGENVNGTNDTGLADTRTEEDEEKTRELIREVSNSLCGAFNKIEGCFDVVNNVTTSGGSGGASGGGSADENVLSEAEEAGFDLRDIKTKVGEVMDRRLQMKLRDVNQNTCFTKVVLDTRGNDREVLICGTDDMIVSFDCIQRITTNWSVKKGTRKYFGPNDAAWEEPPLNDDNYRYFREKATRNLTILSAVVRLYLG